MKVLTINCGSSSLKFDLIETAGNGSALAGTRLVHGLADEIGGVGIFSFEVRGRSRL
jgi:acetate kinase